MSTNVYVNQYINIYINSPRGRGCGAGRRLDRGGLRSPPAARRADLSERETLKPLRQLLQLRIKILTAGT